MKRPERVPAPVPVLLKDFDETHKADDHLMSRVENEGMIPVDADYDASRPRTNP
jgi:hypothetical protein